MWDSKRDTDVLNSLLDSVGEGEGGVIWENGIESCILSYVKWITSPGSMHETVFLGLVHWDDPEGWYGEGGGRGFRMGNTCTSVADSCQCMAKPKKKKKGVRELYLWMVELDLEFRPHSFIISKKWSVLLYYTAPWGFL